MPRFSFDFRLSRAEQVLKKLFREALKIVLSSQTQPDLHSVTIHRILIVRQHDQLGDMLCAIPLLRSLREKYPKASLTLVASPVNHAIMQQNPYLNEVILFDKFSFQRNWIKAVRFIQDLRKHRFDLAIVPATVSISFTSNLIARLSNATLRLGPGSLGGKENSSAYCFTHTVKLSWDENPRLHQAIRTAAVAAPLGIEVYNTETTIGISSTEHRTASQLLEPIRMKYKFLIGIHPGAGKLENRWPAELFAAVANHLSTEFSAGIVITSGPMDSLPVQMVRERLQCEYLLLEGRPIREIASIINELEFFLSNDTGIMHVAAATKTNLLGLFGPTDPLEWMPGGRKNRFLHARDGKMNSISCENVLNVLFVMIEEWKASRR